MLSPLVKEVYTIEIVNFLGKGAERVLKRLGYDNVHVGGGGHQGWPNMPLLTRLSSPVRPKRRRSRWSSSCVKAG